MTTPKKQKSPDRNKSIRGYPNFYPKTIHGSFCPRKLPIFSYEVQAGLLTLSSSYWPHLPDRYSAKCKVKSAKLSHFALCIFHFAL